MPFPLVEVIALIDVGIRAIDALAHAQGGQLDPVWVEQRHKLMNQKADAMKAKADALARQTQEDE
jgi:predicted RecB family nuclease